MTPSRALRDNAVSHPIVLGISCYKLLEKKIDDMVNGRELTMSRLVNTSHDLVFAMDLSILPICPAYGEPYPAARQQKPDKRRHDSVV